MALEWKKCSKTQVKRLCTADSLLTVGVFDSLIANHAWPVFPKVIAPNLTYQVQQLPNSSWQKWGLQKCLLFEQSPCMVFPKGQKTFVMSPHICGFTKFCTMWRIIRTFLSFVSHWICTSAGVLKLAKTKHSLQLITSADDCSNSQVRTESLIHFSTALSESL